jgi:hypothetical protein
LLDSTVRPIFLPSVPLMNPRMLWFCQRKRLLGLRAARR